MGEGFISRGFLGRRRSQDTALPPGQYLVDGFPVLSAGPTPRTPLEEWDFSIVGEVDEPKRWTWEEFRGSCRQVGADAEDLLEAARGEPERYYLVADEERPPAGLHVANLSPGSPRRNPSVGSLPGPEVASPHRERWL